MSNEPLIIDDDRYERLRLISWWDQDKLKAATVVIVGAGALGNEVLKNVALTGIGRVFVIDFDEIETSNLTRSVLFRETDCGKPKAVVAATAARDLNPDIEIIPMEANVITDIGVGLIQEADVLIGCLDNREARLWLNRLCWKAERPWIDGGIQEINGVTKVFIPPNGACYECAMTENDYRLINLRYSCPLLKQEDLAAGRVPTAPTISSIIAGLQTQEALKLIHGLPVADGAALVFNGVANTFYQTRFQHREDCLSHETYGEAIRTGMKASETTVEELFNLIHERCQVIPKELPLDRDFVVGLHCRSCNLSREINQPAMLVGMSSARCSSCEQTMKPELIHGVEYGSKLATRKLSELGIPRYDILRVHTNGDDVFVCLDGDRERVVTGK